MTENKSLQGSPVLQFSSVWDQFGSPTLRKNQWNVHVKIRLDFYYTLFRFFIVLLMVLGMFWGTLGSLKMSISFRRNTDFHVFDPRKCDFGIGTRKNRKKLCFWKDFGVSSSDFFLIKRVLKSSRKKTRKQMRQTCNYLFLGAGPAECAVAGERLDRGQKSKKVRILEKVIGKEFFKSSFVNSWVLSLARSSLP